MLGNVCDTCDFFFERHEGATKRPEVETLKDALVDGVRELAPALLAPLETIVPSGRYEVLLLRVSVYAVQLGTESDYFTNEQVENSGIDGFWGLPRHPKTPYYRASTFQLDERQRFFEFIVPMFPKTWLNLERINYYRERFAQNSCSTAIAISVLDVKTPSSSPKGWDNSETHYCLAHYLLDGHHKIEAAAREGRPISIISFLAIDHGISTPEQVQTVLTALRMG